MTRAPRWWPTLAKAHAALVSSLVVKSLQGHHGVQPCGARVSGIPGRCRVLGKHTHAHGVGSIPSHLALPVVTSLYLGCHGVEHSKYSLPTTQRSSGQPVGRASSPHHALAFTTLRMRAMGARLGTIPISTCSFDPGGPAEVQTIQGPACPVVRLGEVEG
jgi:hypothetical protein